MPPNNTFTTVRRATVAKRYVILRNVVRDNLALIALPEEPEMVMRLLDEERFLQSGAELLHRGTVFIDDRLHDWQWSNGNLRYYGPHDGEISILVVYGTETITREQPMNFCPQCGIDLRLHADHDPQH